MMGTLAKNVRILSQEVIILVAKPYVRRELPGWGQLYTTFVGDFRRDGLWHNAREKIVRGKFHNYLMHLNLEHWADRSAFFLNRWYELDTQLFMNDVIQPGETVVDIGANRGMFTLCASYLVGGQGKVVSFEPNPVSRKLLEREVAANNISNVRVLPYGASDATMTLTLTVPLQNSGEASFGAKNNVDVESYQVEAQVVPADSQLADEKPALIKIDVEGFECQVIAGLKQTLTTHYPIVLVEVIEAHLSACGANRGKLVGILHELGYTGYRLHLKRSKGNSDWSLTPITDLDDSYNAVWMHQSSPGLAVDKILHHAR